MVNPDVDNTTALNTSNTVAVHRDIPASCHKHTEKLVRSVRLVHRFSIIIIIIIISY